jgi:hypothetical protein
MALPTDQRTALSSQDAGPHPPAFVPDSIAFLNLLWTGPVQDQTNADRWLKVGDARTLLNTRANFDRYVLKNAEASA